MEATVAKAKIFTSFDFDHDEDLRTMLVGQSKHEDTPFELSDWSLKAPLTGDWKEKIRTRIKKVDQVIVICGEHTDTAAGVSAELSIAKEEKIPYFLLYGRSSKTCKKPKAASEIDKMYEWTWENLGKLIKGGR